MASVPRPFPAFQSERQASDWVLQHCWDGRIPVDVPKMCKRLGIACLLHEFSDPDTIVETGFVGGRPTIRLSKACYEAGGPRPRFALAHALGHVMLHWELLPNLDAPAPSLSPG